MLVLHLAYETQEISEGEQTKTFRSWWRYAQISVTYLGLWWNKKSNLMLTAFVLYYSRYSSVQNLSVISLLKTQPSWWNLLQTVFLKLLHGDFMSNHVCMSLCSCQVVNAEHFAQTCGSYWIWSYRNSIWTNRAIALKAPAHHFKYS